MPLIPYLPNLIPSRGAEPQFTKVILVGNDRIEAQSSCKAQKEVVICYNIYKNNSGNKPVFIEKQALCLHVCYVQGFVFFKEPNHHAKHLKKNNPREISG